MSVEDKLWLVEDLPLSFDGPTMKTIENIEVIHCTDQLNTGVGVFGAGTFLELPEVITELEL